MALKRMIVICSASMLMGGCSHLLSGAAQYTALSLATEADRLDDVVTPGTLTTRASSRRGSGVDPGAALQQSVRARAGWESLQLHGLTEPALIARRFK